MDSHEAIGCSASSGADDCWGRMMEDRLLMLDSRRFAILDSKYVAPRKWDVDPGVFLDDRFCSLYSEFVACNGALSEVVDRRRALALGFEIEE